MTGATVQLQRLCPRLDAGARCTIVALGDSNTEQTFHTQGRLNWVGLLSEALFERYGNGVATVINVGRCASNVGDALRRCEHDVLRYQPDAVIVALGMNDAVRGRGGLVGFQDGLRELVSQIRTHNDVEILLRTPNPVVTVHGLPLPPEQPQPGHAWESAARPVAEYAAAIVALAAELDCACVDHYTLWAQAQFTVRHGVADPNALWPRMSDAIHPNALGHLHFFRELAPCFDVAERFPWE